MTKPTTLHAAAKRLFADFPLAANPIDPGENVSSVVLMLDRGTLEFFNLTWWPGNVAGDFVLDRWHGDEVPDGEAPGILAQAVPLPRDGSMFGWLDRGAVTALITVYTEYSPVCPVPGWSLRIRADAGEWPPFAGEQLFGRWFWDYHRRGQIVDLSTTVAATPGAVFWVETPQIPGSGSGSCAVAADVRGRGFVLPRGLYVYCDALRDAQAVPSLEDLLAGPKTDLAPRFQER